jgi:hypothetical protein
LWLGCERGCLGLVRQGKLARQGLATPSKFLFYSSFFLTGIFCLSFPLKNNKLFLNYI